MASLAEIRAQYPDLAPLDDDQVVDAVHQAFYSDMPREKVAASFGIKPPEAPPPAPSGKLRRLVADPLLGAAQGAIGLGQSALGLVDPLTGGKLGKALENKDGAFGYRPDDATAFIEQYKSPELQQAKQTVHQAAEQGEGFWEKVYNGAIAAGENPSVILDTVAQSLPMQGAGGVIGKGILWASLSGAEKAGVLALPAAERAAAIQALSPKLAGAAGGIGEGIPTAGQQVEQIRTDPNNPNRELTPTQSALGLGSGLVTGAISGGSGMAAKSAGLEQMQNLLAGVRADRPALVNAATGTMSRVAGSRLGKSVGAGLVEGGQEFAQSGQEQAAQNIATGQPAMAGVPEQAVLGAAAGVAQGGAAHGLFHDAHADPAALKIPDTGPASKSLNAGLDTAQARVDQGLPPTPAPQMQAPEDAAAADKAAAKLKDTAQKIAEKAASETPGPTPVPPAPAADDAKALLAHANERAAALAEKEKGTPDSTAKTPEGEGLTVAGQLPQFLTPEEKHEKDFLKEHGGDAAALQAAYAQREADRPPPPTLEQRQPGDIGGTLSGGAPFTTMAAAMRAQAANPGSEMVNVEGGIVIRPKATEKANESPHQPGDVLNGQGSPFKNKTSVLRAQKGLATPHDVVEVSGGYALRPSATADQPAGGVARPAPVTQVAVAAPAPADKPVAAKAKRASDADARPAVEPAPAKPAAVAPAAVGDDAALNPQSALAGAGKGIVEGLYGGLFDALKAGKTTMAGIKDPVLAKAKPAFDAGLIKSADDLREHVNAGYPALKTSLATDLKPGDKITGTNAAGTTLAGEFGGHTSDGRVKLKQSGGNTHYVSAESVERTGEARTRSDTAEGKATVEPVRALERIAQARKSKGEPVVKEADAPYDPGHENGDGERVAATPAQGTPGNVDAGRAVLRGNEPGAGGSVQRRATITALGISADIEQHGVAALVGRSVTSADDLAQLAQVYRDPRYETLRVFFVKDGKVVHATGVTSRLPGEAPFVPPGQTIESYLAQLRGLLANGTADGFYLLHNHPSGDPAPSREDRQLTASIAKQVPGLLAHVIVNSNKYAVLTPRGGQVEDRLTFKEFGEDELLNASKPSPVLGKSLLTVSDLAALGKSIQKPGYITMIGRASNGTVRAISEAPSAVLTRSYPYMLAMVRRFMRTSGSATVFLAGSNADINSQPVKLAVAHGFIKDAVPEIGQTAVEGGAARVNNGFSDGDTRYTVHENALDTFKSLTTQQGATDAINDLFRTEKTFNGWWHKTVATQYHKAQVDPEHFGKVFNAGQDYLHDTSAFANDAANLAPNVITQLKSLRDVGKRIALSAEDRTALGSSVFDGTLNWTRNAAGELVQPGEDDKAGVVFTPDELRERYGMNDRQIAQYKEFRASVDRSLDILAASDVARYLTDKDLPPAMKKMVSDGDVARFKGLAVALIADRVAEAQTRLDTAKEQMRTGEGTDVTLTAADAATATLERWQTVSDTVAEKYQKIDSLKDRGYAPLMRYGKYTLTQHDAEGKVTFFSMYENERDANKAARNMAEDDHTLTQGVMSQEAFKQFRGMTPETMGLFAELAGIEKSDVFQQYLQLAIANHSALKRLIHRKGTAGYDEDAARALASFVTSNARAASGNMHLGEISEAIANIPKERGDVIDEASKLRDFITNPDEDGGHALRGLSFVTFLGGSMASALVNTTQPLTMTIPQLSEHSNPLRATAAVLKGMFDAITGVSEKPLQDALAKAEREGIVSPQETHQLRAEANRTAGNSPAVRRTLFVWGSLFSLAEQFNRRANFIAAYRIAVENGHADPYAFATDSVSATQGIYNPGNRPNWARGPVGGALMQFKQFSIAYLELLKRLPPREKALAFAILALVSGVQGLPFADDTDNIIDSIAQALGYDFNSKQAKRRWLAQILGDGGAEFAMHGGSAIGGVPIDVSGRMGLGNLLPGTGLFLKSKPDKSQEVASFAGPVGSLAANVGKAIKGDPMALAPTAIQNLAKAVDMLRTGMYRDSKGKQVIATTNVDAAMKAIGFQPQDVAKVQRAESVNLQQIALAKATQQEITAAWALGIFEKDPAKVEAAQKELRAWNSTNPESRILVSRPAIVSQVRQMMATKAQRDLKSAPKSMRGNILAESATQ